MQAVPGQHSVEAAPIAQLLTGVGGRDASVDL